jgi:DNA-binding MarR family transcriptional regulator
MPRDLVTTFADLVRLETELWNRVEARVRAVHGLGLAPLEVMRVVHGAPGCRVLDVARALSITVGGASKVVDRVEASGWCRRLPHPRDGRSNVLQLTARGEQLLGEANTTAADALALYLGAGAPASDLEQFSRTINRLRQHLDATSPVPLDAPR